MYFYYAKGAVYGDDLAIVPIFKEVSLVEQGTNRVIQKMRRWLLAAEVRENTEGYPGKPHKRYN